MKRNALKLAALAGTGVMVAACTSASGGTFPQRRIEMIVPFAAGGGTDSLARLWADCFEDKLGETVTVVNQEGGAGAAGAVEAANADPDGYTVIVSTATTTTILPAVEEDLGYTAESYDYLALLGTAPDVIFTHEDSQYETIDDVLEAAKAEPGGLPVAGYVSTSSSRFRPEEFEHNNDVSWKTVPYETADEIVRSVLGGDADLGYNYLAIPLVEQVNNGPLKIIAAGEDISAAVEGVPTYEELGLEGFSGPDAVNFYLHAPAGLPDDVRTVWEDAAVECREDDRLADLLEVQAMPPDSMVGSNLQDLVKEETAAYDAYMSELYPPE